MHHRHVPHLDPSLRNKEITFRVMTVEACLGMEKDEIKLTKCKNKMKYWADSIYDLVTKVLKVRLQIVPKY